MRSILNKLLTSDCALSYGLRHGHPISLLLSILFTMVSTQSNGIAYARSVLAF